MSIPFFFIDKELKAVCDESVSVEVSKAVATHMQAVRLRSGEHIVLVDSPGHGWEIELSAVPDKRTGLISGRAIAEHHGAPSVDLTLVQGISATERMDQTIRQVTELGVSRIIPLESERSTVRLTPASRKTKLERWQRIARGAAEQSCRLTLPDIDAPLDLPATLEALSDYDLLLFFWEEVASVSELSSRPGLHSLSELSFRPDLKVAVLIGPEGGFSQGEAERIMASGARTVSLGETILRTETAAVVATTLVLYRLGGLGGS